MADSPTSRRRPPFPLLPPDKAPASPEAKGQERFAFATPAAREAWYRAAYNQAVNAESWASGDPMDDQTRQAIELGIAGATAPYYKGPDDRYYFHNARTVEDASTRAHRAQHVAGKTMDQIAAAKVMPGTDEYVALLSRTRGAANDNKTMALGHVGASEESGTTSLTACKCPNCSARNRSSSPWDRQKLMTNGTQGIRMSSNCAEERRACYDLCSIARYDPSMSNIWGGSYERCVLGCLSAECGGNSVG